MNADHFLFGRYEAQLSEHMQLVQMKISELVVRPLHAKDLSTTYYSNSATSI